MTDKINLPYKLGFVGVFSFTETFCNRNLHLMRARVSGGHLCEAEAPTEAAAETVDFAKQKTEEEIVQTLTTPQSCLRQASSPDKGRLCCADFLFLPNKLKTETLLKKEVLLFHSRAIFIKN